MHRSDMKDAIEDAQNCDMKDARTMHRSDMKDAIERCIEVT